MSATKLKKTKLHYTQLTLTMSQDPEAVYKSQNIEENFKMK